MEAELKTLIKVSTTVTASMAYARFASSKIPPGNLRLLALLPVLSLLVLLPFSFTTINLRGLSAYFLSWLALFKLLLLSSGHPPLSPSLPFLTFIAVATLPVKPKSPSASPPPTSHVFAKAVISAAFLPLYRYCHHAHPFLLALLYYAYMQLSLTLLLSALSAVAGVVLGVDLEPQFDAPLHADNIQDFWARRWNLAYVPNVNSTMVRFIISGVMHELMIYYLTATLPTGEVVCFFVVHGVCAVVEERGRKGRWWPRPAVALPLEMGFFAATLSWLFFPPIVRSGVGDRALEECGEVVGVLVDGGRALVGGLLGSPGNYWSPPAGR